MSIQDAMYQMLFIGVFNVIGGLALGHGLRALIHDRSLRDIFFIVWGAMFGGVPAIVAAARLLAAHTGPLFLVNPILFVSAIVLSMTILTELAQDLGAGTLLSIGVGTAFMFVGVGVGMSALTKGSLASALVGGGLFVLAGGLLFALGINSLIRGKQTT